MKQMLIDHILLNIMKRTEKKNICTWIQLQDALRAIFAEQFGIANVDLF